MFFVLFVYLFSLHLNIAFARFDIQCEDDSQVYPDWVQAQTCFQQKFRDIYIFGDSYSDNGQPLKSWRYYQDHFFPERYINGPTCAEYFSKLMGANLYNFAYSGATVDNTIVYRSTLDIHQQLEVFYQKGGPIKSPNETLYTFWVGTNDVDQTFETQTDTTLREKVIDNTLKSLYNALETLYNMSPPLSVKYILIMGLLPIDHMPQISNMITEESQRGPMTSLVGRYNNGLDDLVAGRFQQQYPEAQVYFYDTNGFVNWLFSGPNTPFTDVAHACSVQNRICSDETRYFWWDNVHPSTAASYMIAKNMYETIKF